MSAPGHFHQPQHLVELVSLAHRVVPQVQLPPGLHSVLVLALHENLRMVGGMHQQEVVEDFVHERLVLPVDVFEARVGYLFFRCLDPFQKLSKPRPFFPLQDARTFLAQVRKDSPDFPPNTLTETFFMSNNLTLSSALFWLPPPDTIAIVC